MLTRTLTSPILLDFLPRLSRYQDVAQNFVQLGQEPVQPRKVLLCCLSFTRQVECYSHLCLSQRLFLRKKRGQIAVCLLCINAVSLFVFNSSPLLNPNFRLCKNFESVKKFSPNFSKIFFRLKIFFRSKYLSPTIQKNLQVVQKFFSGENFSKVNFAKISLKKFTLTHRMAQGPKQKIYTVQFGDNEITGKVPTSKVHKFTKSFGRKKLMRCIVRKSLAIQV